MEGKLEYKRDQLSSAVINFEDSLSLRLSEYPPLVIDSIKSGRVQKFEFCIELLWKTIKVFLLEINGIEVKSPKLSVKEFHNYSYINSDEYVKLIELLDCRNRLSHVYNKEQFEEIYEEVINSLNLFQSVLKALGN